MSRQDEARKLMEQELREAFWERVDRVQQRLAGQFFPDSTDLIREDRDRETRPEGAEFE